MVEFELERTFLAKYLPEDLFSSPHKEIIDMYIPQSAEHPKLRIRKNGGNYSITKKIQASGEDVSTHYEHTIELTPNEFDSLSKVKPNKLHKVRYYYEYLGKTAEIDVFTEELEGLVLVDFEFSSESERDEFEMPIFCLADITQETFIAGGILAGKSYADIESDLNRFQYKKISFGVDDGI